MQNFVVTWTIDITAETPEDAAAEALEIQRDYVSSALLFECIDEAGEKHRVDLYGIDAGEIL